MSSSDDDTTLRALRAMIDETTRARASRLAALLAEMGAHRRDMAARFHDLGAALLEIKREKLYTARGAGSLAELLRVEGGVSPRQARKLMKVAAGMTAAQALPLGLERSYALLTHVEQAGGRGDLGAWLSGRRTIGGEPVERASRRAIEAATRALRAEQEGPRAPGAAARKAARANGATARRVRQAMRAADWPTGDVTATAKRVVITLDRAAVDAWLGEVSRGRPKR